VPGFNLCVQWHPEWMAAHNPISLKLFRAFGEACVLYRDRHRAPQPAALRA
jgi:putative glutamine amidotransferase